MAIAIKVRQSLCNNDLDFTILNHPHSRYSMETAKFAHIPGDKLVKTVLLQDDTGFITAVIPATHYILMQKLHNQTHRIMDMATEHEVAQLFHDCELGAIPPIGDAYGCDVIVDNSLSICDDVYFESGDHENLIHMKGESFQKLMQSAQHGDISLHM